MVDRSVQKIKIFQLMLHKDYRKESLLVHFYLVHI
jgi:hypothetical protein